MDVSQLTTLILKDGSVIVIDLIALIGRCDQLCHLEFSIPSCCEIIKVGPAKHSVINEQLLKAVAASPLEKLSVLKIDLCGRSSKCWGLESAILEMINELARRSRP